MRKTVSEYLSVEPLGNIIEIRARGLRPTNGEELDAKASGVWLTGSYRGLAREVTVECTLSVDAAMDLRDEINTWLESRGVKD